MLMKNVEFSKEKVENFCGNKSGGGTWLNPAGAEHPLEFGKYEISFVYL